jgi:hypothetical protein
MAVHRATSVDVEIMSVGQYDKVECWRGRRTVTRGDDGRVLIGSESDGIAVDWDDLVRAVDLLSE